MTETREQIIEAKGMGPGRVSEALITIAGAQGYSVAASGPNRFRLARTFRPKWANVLSLVLAPFFGIGLLFLLVKRTESCESIIVEDRTGVRLNINGSVAAGLFMALHDALTSTNVPAPHVTPTAFTAPQAVPTPDRPVATPVHQASPPMISVPDEDRTITAAQLAAMRGGGALALQFADGRAVPVGVGLVVGRNPDADPAVPSADAHRVNDPSMSKTHATVGVTANAIWVCDHHSTNGTTVRINGSVTTCQPGARVDVPLGGAITFGEVQVTVVAAS